MRPLSRLKRYTRVEMIMIMVMVMRLMQARQTQTQPHQRLTLLRECLKKCPKITHLVRLTLL